MSIVYHFLRQRNLQHSLSVFTAECGLDSKSAWLSELDIVQSLRFGSNSKVYREILERESSEISTANYSVFDVLLDHFCSDVKRGTAEVGVQTESSTSGLGPREFLDTQVSELRRAFLLRRDAERDAPLRTVEERMLSFQRECEERYRRETEAYASYLKETEIAKVRLEEAEKARVEIEKLKGQLDTDYQRRLNEQAEREAASLRSMADRERQLQQTQYEARQKLQREIDDLRAREKASVRRFELETQGLQTLELRLKEAKILLESREREALNREREAEERLKNSLDLARAEARNSLRAELEDLSRERGALKLERQRLDDDRSSQEALLESANTTRRMLREAQAALLEKDDKISILTKQVEALMAAAREEEEANESFFDASNTVSVCGVLLIVKPTN
jgi:oral-facial-digital syndrome 1 protein